MKKYIKIKPIDMKDKSHSVIGSPVFLHSIVVGLTMKAIQKVSVYVVNLLYKKLCWLSSPFAFQIFQFQRVFA